MKCQIKNFALILALASLAGCGTTEKAMQEKGVTPLSGTELRELLVGSTMNYRNTNGIVSTVNFRADGSAAVSWASGSDIGTWRIAGNTFCSKWNEVRSGQERCSRSYRDGEKYVTFESESGNRLGEYTVSR